jgi:hypothetical protein
MTAAAGIGTFTGLVAGILILTLGKRWFFRTLVWVLSRGD